MRRLAVVVLAAVACGDEPVEFNGCEFETPDTGDCGFRAQQGFVEGVMRAHYLFSEQLVDVDPAAHEDLGSFLRALTAEVEPADRFTFVTTVTQEQRFFVEGKSLGFGFSLATDGEGRIRLREVFGTEADESPSPASEAGLRRGDTIIAIGDVSIEDLRATGDLNTALFDHEPEDVVAFDVDTGRQTRRVELAYDFFVLDPVPTVRVIQEGDLSIGYVLIRNFSEPTVTGLLQGFGRLRNVDALVVDLRYNGGGLISAAETLADLVGGLPLLGRVFYESQFNERNRACGATVRFLPQRLGLVGAAPIAVIATGGTASASELVINGLRAHADVDIVGSRSFGKPVGQLGFAFCGRVLRPTTFQLVNADGEGDYFDGLEPSCASADDVDHALGDPDEAMLRASLDLLVAGECATDKSSFEPEQLVHLEDPNARPSGWWR